MRVIFRRSSLFAAFLTASYFGYYYLKPLVTTIANSKRRDPAITSGSEFVTFEFFVFKDAVSLQG